MAVAAAPVDDMHNVRSYQQLMICVLKISKVTGCIRPENLSRLNVNDAGGQYDSSGGVGGRGNPQDSVCLG